MLIFNTGLRTIAAGLLARPAVYEADPNPAFLPTFTVALDRALTLILTARPRP
ncbi:hypothetical protein [Nocardia fluminea]|uniref:hypothetical protein n=1 Tax=Nocardia fluminea TaxID=134984 RepID=UPI0036582EEF